MTKKDYEKAALIAQDVRRGLDDSHARAVENAFVELFRGDNYRFDTDRFLRACVPGANVKARS